jgi:hypothetical protein
MRLVNLLIQQHYEGKRNECSGDWRHNSSGYSDLSYNHFIREKEKIGRRIELVTELVQPEHNNQMKKEAACGPF